MRGRSSRSLLYGQSVLLANFWRTAWRQIAWWALGHSGHKRFDALPCASDFADLPGEDETFVALKDSKIVALVTRDDAPDLVDELDTDEQVQPE